jgi:hypothetical protein
MWDLYHTKFKTFLAVFERNRTQFNTAIAAFFVLLAVIVINSPSWAAL